MNLTDQESHLSCMICLDIANQAVETSCCHQLFCETCLDSVKDKTSCPNCRNKFKPIIAYFVRRLIGNLFSTCPNGCGQTFTYTDKDNHLKQCPNRILKCPNCGFSSSKQLFLEHLIEKHENIIIENIERLFSSAPSSSNVDKPNMTLKTNDRIERSINDGGRYARLGSSGKFYCEGPLNTYCSCCNGKCGPTNGCNCVHCMKLDVEKQKLSHGWFVNSDGASARKSVQTKLFYCGRRVLMGVLGCDGYCGPTDGPNCQACQKLSRQQDRYASIW